MKNIALTIGIGIIVLLCCLSIVIGAVTFSKVLDNLNGKEEVVTEEELELKGTTVPSDSIMPTVKDDVKVTILNKSMNSFGPNGFYALVENKSDVAVSVYVYGYFYNNAVVMPIDSSYAQTKVLMPNTADVVAVYAEEAFEFDTYEFTYQVFRGFNHGNEYYLPAEKVADCSAIWNIEDEHYIVVNRMMNTSDIELNKLEALVVMYDLKGNPTDYYKIEYTDNDDGITKGEGYFDSYLLEGFTDSGTYASSSIWYFATTTDSRYAGYQP